MESGGGRRMSLKWRKIDSFVKERKKVILDIFVLSGDTVYMYGFIYTFGFKNKYK